MSTVRIPAVELTALLIAIFERNRCSPEVARLLAENMTLAQGDGALSHGVFRVAGLLASLRVGWVDGHAVPTVENTAPGMVRADGRDGFALPALAAAREQLVAKTRANGIALLSVRNSHHFSALWPDIEPLAREDFIALMMVNSMATVVPHGGTKPVFGTNPIAFAAPRAGADPLIFDLATAAWSNGDVQIARREGRLLPPNVGIDRDGKPTTDPADVLEGGALLTFGGHKGAAISMMMEIIAAGLGGGDFSFEVDWSKHPGATTPRTAQTIILIDPARGQTRDFTSRLEVLLSAIREAGQERLPADRRYANRRDSERLGVALTETELAELRQLAGT